MDRLRMGLVMPESTTTGLSVRRERESVQANAEVFCAALAQRAGMPITAHGFGDYRALLEAISQGAVEIAWLPPVIALRSSSQGATMPIALPVRGGSASFSTALFARPDSPIRELEHIRHLTVAWVDHHSAAGYLVIRAWMRAQNVDLGEAFSEELFTGSHPSVVDAVMLGRADLGATFAHVDAQSHRVVRAAWGKHKVRVVALAGPIPADVIAASIRVSVPTIRQIQAALIAEPSDEFARAVGALFDAEGFIPAESAHMAPLTELLSHLDNVGQMWHSWFPGSR